MLKHSSHTEDYPFPRYNAVLQKEKKKKKSISGADEPTGQQPKLPGDHQPLW